MFCVFGKDVICKTLLNYIAITHMELVFGVQRVRLERTKTVQMQIFFQIYVLFFEVLLLSNSLILQVVFLFGVQ